MDSFSLDHDMTPDFMGHDSLFDDPFRHHSFGMMHPHGFAHADEDPFDMSNPFSDVDK